MNGLAAGALGVSGLFLVVIALVLAILGLLMPLYVYRISQETKKIREALDRVEGLSAPSRNGWPWTGYW